MKLLAEVCRRDGRQPSAAARRTIGLAWRTDVALSPAAQRMLDFVRNR